MNVTLAGRLSLCAAMLAVSAPAVAQMQLSSIDPRSDKAIERPPPSIGRILDFQEQTAPDWSAFPIPRIGHGDDKRRGFSFSVRPSKGVKAVARLRF